MREVGGKEVGEEVRCCYKCHGGDLADCCYGEKGGVEESHGS